MPGCPFNDEIPDALAPARFNIPDHLRERFVNQLQMTCVLVAAVEARLEFAKANSSRPALAMRSAGATGFRYRPTNVLLRAQRRRLAG